ncbi:MAG TPA: 4Fe-4S binding protein [Clostridia bacterium]|nr:4Fe-4S binding protein [Clostridia bacterium]
MKSQLTRRDLFSLLVRPFQAPAEVPAQVLTEPQVAVVQGRHCLALTSFCAACVERCPVPGAMKLSQGMPQVVADACTGCGICHQVCPAPVNAVLLLPRRRQPSRALTIPTQ